MDDHATSIFEALNDAGIDHDAGSLSKHPTQGLMSSVYTISTQHGGLIIHVSKLTPTLEYFRIWEKLKPISEFLRAIPGVPAAEVLFTMKWPHHFLAVQRRLPGHSAGTAEFKNDEIVCTWKDAPDIFEEQMEGIVAKVHQAPIEGFGQLIAKEGALRGRYDSWEEFLKTEVPLWLEGIEQGDRARNSPPDTLIDDAKTFWGKILPRVASLERASLVSCDMMNPSNILVEGTVITGIIDWEWSLAADPAWEFAYINPFALAHYFSHFPSLSDPEAQKDFFERAQIYEYLLYIMWCFAVSGDPQSKFFEISRGRLKRKFAGAEEFLEKLGLN
jgi:hypothetical protein